MELLALALVAAAQLPAPHTVQPARLERPPVIDGRLDDDVWQSASRVEGFRQVQPGDNIDPSERTEVLIGYDKRALYIAFRAHDSSGRIRATFARRDAIDSDDMVGLYLDTFNDRRRAYYVFFNPHGIQADGVYTEGAAAPDLSVDLVIDSAGRIDAQGYTVEAAIPFASLRYRTGVAPAWGLLVQRFIRRDRNEQISWTPLSRNRSSLLAQAGLLVGLQNIGDGRPLEIIPTGITTQTDAEAGLTANLGITPTLNATLTVNPDFAQVEADQLILTLNQRFPILYEEKRPFFLEGADAFRTPINLFHTRTIVEPDVAIKLSGKQGRTTIGVIAADDNGLKAAARVKQDVGGESTVGVAMTSVRGDSYDNDVISADARLRLTPTTVLTSQLAGTFSDTAGAEKGLSYLATLERRGRHWLTAVTTSGVSPGYRAALGFTRRVDTNAVSLTNTYSSEPKPDAPLISWTATNTTFVQWDWDGRSTLIYVYPQARLTFRRQTYLRALAFRDYERIFGDEFIGGFSGDSERSTTWEGYGVQIGTAPAEAIALSATISHSWDVFDYDFGAGAKFPRVSPAALANSGAPRDPGPARSASYGGDVTWRPSDALRTSLEISRNTLVRDDTGLTAYDATLVSWRTTYQFTRFTFARLRTDWDSASATLRGQYLVAWTPSPGTAVYAGYNDEATIDGYDRFSGARLPGYRRQGRTAFVKLSWMFRTML